MVPLKEEIVVKVMEKYLKAKHYHSGPDFHLAGKAYEAKGSDSDFADTLNQLSDYAYSGKYTEVNAVFPADFLASAYKLEVFHLFCRILENKTKQDLGLFLVWTSNGKDFMIKALKGRELLQHVEIQIMSLLYTRLKDAVTGGTSVATVEDAVAIALEIHVTSSSIKITL